MANELISAILQILVFSLIPFLVYVIKARKVKGFLNYVGLKKSTTKANLLGLAVTIVMAGPLLALILTKEEFRKIMTNPESVSGKIREMGVGVEAIVIILIAAIFKTALSEEIFFRGFLAKRLIAVTNFQTGNIIQAIIFGLIHTLLFMSITDNIFFLAAIFIFPTLGAYLTTYLNEKVGNGSIIPGWIAHATANLISYGTILFI
jgi:uncharacterized protein